MLTGCLDSRVDAKYSTMLPRQGAKWTRSCRFMTASQDASEDTCRSVASVAPAAKQKYPTNPKYPPITGSGTCWR